MRLSSIKHSFMNEHTKETSVSVGTAKVNIDKVSQQKPDSDLNSDNNAVDFSSSQTIELTELPEDFDVSAKIKSKKSIQATQAKEKQLLRQLEGDMGLRSIDIQSFYQDNPYGSYFKAEDYLQDAIDFYSRMASESSGSLKSFYQEMVQQLRQQLQQKIADRKEAITDNANLSSFQKFGLPQNNLPSVSSTGVPD